MYETGKYDVGCGTFEYKIYNALPELVEYPRYCYKAEELPKLKGDVKRINVLLATEGPCRDRDLAHKDKNIRETLTPLSTTSGGTATCRINTTSGGTKGARSVTAGRPRCRPAIPCWRAMVQAIKSAVRPYTGTLRAARRMVAEAVGSSSVVLSMSLWLLGTREPISIFRRHLIGGIGLVSLWLGRQRGKFEPYKCRALKSDNKVALPKSRTTPSTSAAPFRIPSPDHRVSPERPRANICHPLVFTD